MRKLARYAGGAVILAVLIYSGAAYFTGSVHAGQLFDGLGRPLEPSPWFIRAALGQDRLWAGWLWFLVDMVVFWGGIFVGVTLFSVEERRADSKG